MELFIGWTDEQKLADPEYMLYFKYIRNKLLTQSDWTQMVDAPLTEAERVEWRVYRQALRDLPTTTTMGTSIRLMEAADTYGFSLQNLQTRFGFFRHSASSAGSEIISISRDNPFVGIGTTDPGNVFQVGAAVGGIYANNPLSQSNVIIFGDSPNKPSYSGTPGGATLFVNSTNANASNVGASIALGGRGTDFGGGQQHMTFARIQGTQAVTNGAYYGNFVIETQNSGTLYERMRIDQNGYVGIGTASPGCQLDVLGTTRLIGDGLGVGGTAGNQSNVVCYLGNGISNYFGGLRVLGTRTATGTDWTTTSLRIQKYVDSSQQGYMEFGAPGGNTDIAFGSAGGTERMRITSGGNVGIGTTNPAYKLEVAGIGNTIAATNLQSTVTQTMGTSTTIGFTGTKTNHNTYIVSNNGTGGNIILNAAGTAFYPLSGSTCELGGASNRWSTIYAVNALNTSDGNLKENISDAPLGIEFVNALNPRTFTWKEYTQTVVNPVTDEPRTVTKPAGTRLQYGLIAQEVKDVLDKFNIDPKDFAGYVDSTVNEPDKPQVLYLNYIQFIPILIKSVKELSAENTALEARLAALEAKLNSV